MTGSKQEDRDAGRGRRRGRGTHDGGGGKGTGRLFIVPEHIGVDIAVDVKSLLNLETDSFISFNVMYSGFEKAIIIFFSFFISMLRDFFYFYKYISKKISKE